jgi:Secretion system C-terminal sorting domain
MRAKFSFFCALLAIGTQAQNFDWAKAASSSKDADGKGLSIGRNNQIYVIGDFTESLKFNSTATATAPATKDATKSGFLASYDAQGNLLWHRNLLNGGNKKELTTDGIAKNSDDELWVTGKFITSATIADKTISATGNKKAFYLAKFDATGKVLWTFAQGTTTAEIEGKRVVVDATGHSYVSGKLKGGAASLGSFALTYSTESSGENGFIAKFSPEGTLLWAKTITDTNAGKSGIDDLKVDANGHIFVVGKFDGELTLGHGTTKSLTSSGSENFLVAKLDADGNCLWAKAAGSASGTNKNTGKSIVLGADGAIYTVGDFDNGISFDDSGDFDYNNPGKNSWLAKWSADGALQWVRPHFSGALSSDEFKIDALVVDGNGELLTVGKFTSTVSVGSLGSMSSAGGKNSFLINYNAGQPLSFKAISGSLDVEAKRLALDNEGKAVVTGSYRSKLNLDGAGELNYEGGTAKNFFITKYQSAMASTLGLAQAQNEAQAQVQVYPNPVLEGLAITWPQALKAQQIKLMDAQGQVLQQYEVQGALSQDINMSVWPKGLYFVNIKDQSGKAYSHKISKK